MKKRIMAMLLAMVMVVSLAGCGRGDTRKLVGKWHCKVGAEEFLMEEVPEEFENAVEYFAFDELYLPVCLEFKEDSIFCAYVDEQEFKEMMHDYADSFIDGLGRYLVDMIYEETGMTVTQDELWVLAGISEQEIRDMIAVEVEDSMKEVSAFYEEGRFKAEEGRLYLSDDLDSEFDPAEYLAYSLDDDEFSIIGAVGKDKFLGDFPLVFEKVG